MKPRLSHRVLAAVGALFAAAGVALSAYAAHGAEASIRADLQSAAMFALMHGVALAALSRQTPHRIGTLALWALALGVLLFSGSLVVGRLFDAPTAFAPVGGTLMIVGWLLYAIDALRH
jgi:uncharacterized membrane protein YgdD (TMEM256/DUF423 family)